MIRRAEGGDPGAQAVAGGLGVFRQSSSRVTPAGGGRMTRRRSQILTQAWVVTEPAGCGRRDEG